MCCSIGQLRVAPKDQRLRRFGRPGAAASIHLFIAEIEAAPRGRNFIEASPTNCCCENTHVFCRLSHLRVAPKSATTHMCAAKSIKTGLHPGVEMLQRFGRPGAAASTHMCAAEHSNSGFRPRINGYKGLADHRLLLLQNSSTQGLADQTLQGAYTCVLQNRRIQGSSQGSNPGSKVTKVWPTSFCCEHTCVFQTTSSTGGAGVRTHLARAHVSCRTNQSSVAPMDQGLQRFGRPNAAVSTHTHTCLLRHNGVADQLLL